jgi:hypothetical protein
MKKIRGNKPSGVLILICMEISQGNALYCYFYLKQVKKCHIFLFYLLFSSTKSDNRRADRSYPRGLWYQWERRNARERA